MAYKHISDETTAIALDGTELFVFDKDSGSSVYITRKVSLSTLTTYITAISVTSITGTSNQILVNNIVGTPQIGDITLTLPQNIATTSSPQFAYLGLGAAADVAYALKAVGDVDISGNITSATWNGDTISVTKGGTGTSTQFTQGSIVFAGPSGVYAQNNSKLFWDDTQQFLGIGTNTQAVDETLGVAGVVIFDVPSTTQSFGFYSKCIFSPTSSTSEVAHHYLLPYSRHTSGVTITNMYGIKIEAITKLGTGSVTNAYGLYVLQPTAATNNYVAYLGGNTIVTGTLRNDSLTASRLVATDASKNLVSTTPGTFISASAPITFNGATSVIGLSFNTTNLQNTSGGALNTIQDIASSSSPAFTNLTLSGTAAVGGTSTQGTLQIWGGSSGLWLTNNDFINGSAGSGCYLQTSASTGSAYIKLQAFKTGNTVISNLSLNESGGYISMGTSPTSGQKLKINVDTQTFYGINLTGNMATLDGGNTGSQIGFYSNQSLSPGFNISGAVYNFYAVNQIGLNSVTAPNVAIFAAEPTYACVGVGAVTNAINFWSKAGTNSGAANTITHGFGGRFDQPAWGNTSKKALYAENLVVGSTYISNSPASNGALIQGKVAINVSTALLQLHVAGTSTGPTASGNISSGTLLLQSAGTFAMSMGNFDNSTTQYSWLQSHYSDNAGVTRGMAINPLGGDVSINTTPVSGRALAVLGDGAGDNVILAKSSANNSYVGFADLNTSDQTGLSVRIGSSGNGLLLQTGGTTTRIQIDSTGNIVTGTGAEGTSSTSNFFYIATCAGAPTGTPTSFTGRVAMRYDTTNNKIYFYNGAWRSVAVT
jgi:hypothetical protein